MPSDGRRAENPQQQQADTMSGPLQESSKEMKPAIPVFSYAQAAKSKAPSVPVIPSAGMAKSETGDTGTKMDTEADPIPSFRDSKNDSAKRTISEGGKPQRNDFKVSGEPGTNKMSANGTEKDLGSGVQSKAAGSGTQITHTAPSPDFGASSISTLPKDEDGFSAVNGSSESTWDKQSQTSHNGSKNDERAIAEKDAAQKASDAPWDETKPESALLKEAPPPPVNIWAQRMAQIPKTKPQQTAPLQTSKQAVMTNGTGGASEPARPTESSGEQRKQENRKKSKGNVDDRLVVKENNKSADGKAKNGEGSTKANPSTMAPPPPPGDAISWPTPDTALEEKRKLLNRTEKDDKEKTPNPKPHGKKEWQTVPFVPTVNFNTPMPTSRTRGGRGSGGGARENGGRGRNTNGIDKPTSTGASPMNSFPNDERGKAALISSTAAQNTQKSKRASSAGPTIVKEQRKSGDTSGGEKRKDSDLTSTKSSQGKGAGTIEPRRQSATAVNESYGSKGMSGRGPPRDAINTPKKSQNTDDIRSSQDTASTGQVPPKMTDLERRSEGSTKPQESAKDAQANTALRERGEGRSERGSRGGYRGRGGSSFNPYNSHLTNGHGFSGPPPQYQQSVAGPPSRSFSNHERLASQPQGPYYPPNPPQNRTYRSNSRSHSIQHTYGRFSHQPHGGPPHLANLQTDMANNFGYPFDPQPGSMSAIPFNPYVPGPSIYGMVAVQMEYYFSVDNLCKDTYLRKNMNSQGWVPLELVAGFNRIKQLTPDINVVRDVCFGSSVIEARVAEDESVWLRKHADWQQWVMDLDTRVPGARDDGPRFATFQPFNAYGATQAFNEGHEVSPRSGTASVPLDNLQYQSLDGAAAPVHQVVMAPAEQHNGTNAGNQAPLSAAVSEFSPSVRSSNGRLFSSPDPHAQGTSIISNEEMDKLNITFRAKPADIATPVLPPFHSASSRTFSNGSIDGTAISGELAKFAERQSRPILKGEKPDSGDRSNINRSCSPFSVGSPGRLASTSSPPVLWFKSKEHLSRVNSLPTEYTHASYPAFRQNALGQRERVTDACVYDMQVLYAFWAHFLIRNFNLFAYEEFHRMAIEDESTRQSSFGMKSLIQYYDEALLGQRTIPNESIASDFIEIVKQEVSKGEGPMFKKLRAAWRNGAWNAKNRSKISKSIDTALTTELDK